MILSFPKFWLICFMICYSRLWIRFWYSWVYITFNSFNSYSYFSRTIFKNSLYSFFLPLRCSILLFRFCSSRAEFFIWESSIFFNFKTSVSLSDDYILLWTACTGVPDCFVWFVCFLFYLSSDFSSKIL